jgi:hypothetical protein
MPTSDFERFDLTRRATFVQKMLNQLSRHISIEDLNIHPVVFESDDWGMCGEAKDRKTLKELTDLEHGPLKLYKMEYNNTLESSDDLLQLFSILRSKKDSLRRPAVFTANHVMSNPDFKLIERFGFRSYHYIPINAGFPEGWERGDLRKRWIEGMQMNVWRPEFHALHHFNFKTWLRFLRSGEKYTRWLFDLGIVYYPRKKIAESEYVLDARIGRYEELEEQTDMVFRGCKIFLDTFNYWPQSTIPPHDAWNLDTEVAFCRVGLKYIQTERNKPSLVLFPPFPWGSPLKSVLAGSMILTYFVKVLRNVWLEPRDSLSYAMEAYQYIMKNGLAAIVGTHRANYVSTVNPEMCSAGRRRLESFLKFLSEDDKLVFLSASELSQILSRGYSILTNYDEMLVHNYTNNLIKLPSSFERCEMLDLTKDAYINGNDWLKKGSIEVPPRTSTLITNRR